MTPEEALEKAIDEIGSMQAMADGLGITKSAVGQWKLPDRKVPAEHCPTIERLAGHRVTCEQLRPDVEWQVLLARNAPRPNRRSTDRVT